MSNQKRSKSTNRSTIENVDGDEALQNAKPKGKANELHTNLKTKIVGKKSQKQICDNNNAVPTEASGVSDMATTRRSRQS